MYSTFLLLNYFQRVLWAQSCILEMHMDVKEYNVLYTICSIHVHFIERCIYVFLCGYAFWFQCYILILFKSLNFKIFEIILLEKNIILKEPLMNPEVIKII